MAQIRNSQISEPMIFKTRNPLLRHLEALYKDQSFNERLVALAYSFCKNHETAKDLVQDAFFKVCNRLQNLQEVKTLKGFVYQTVLNTAKDWKRASVVRQNYDQYLVNTLKVENIYTFNHHYELKQFFEYVDQLNLFNAIEHKIFNLWRKGYKNREIVEELEEVPNSLFVVRSKERMMNKLRRCKGLKKA